MPCRNRHHTIITFESFRPKGAIDTAHQHPDHHSVVYQKQGRTRMQIGEETFIVEAGDSYFRIRGMIFRASSTLPARAFTITVAHNPI